MIVNLTMRHLFILDKDANNEQLHVTVWLSTMSKTQSEIF